MFESLKYHPTYSPIKLLSVIEQVNYFSFFHFLFSFGHSNPIHLVYCAIVKFHDSFIHHQCNLIALLLLFVEWTCQFFDTVLYRSVFQLATIFDEAFHAVLKLRLPLNFIWWFRSFLQVQWNLSGEEVFDHSPFVKYRIKLFAKSWRFLSFDRFISTTITARSLIINFYIASLRNQFGSYKTLCSIHISIRFLALRSSIKLVYVNKQVPLCHRRG